MYLGKGQLVGTTWVAYRLSRRLWPGAKSEGILTGSESTGTERYSWRKPGRWRVAYAVPWLAYGVLYFLTFGGVMSRMDYVLALVPALFPAVGFLLIRPKEGLGVVALLGLPIAAWLLALVALVDYGVAVSQVARWGLLIALVAALLASLIAFVVLPKKWVWDLLNGLP